MKRLVLLLITVSVLLTSCSFFDGVAEKLGFDTYDYMGEKVISVLPNDGDEAETARDVLSVIVSNSGVLETFDNMAEGVKLYSDTVLGYMIATEYGKYSGNTDLINKAAKEYPEYGATLLIPQKDYEAMMYRYFGGDVKITNGDTTRFKYMSRINAYSATVLPEQGKYSPKIIHISETERTYRVRFKLVNPELEEELTDPEYFALIIKRTDGTYYIKKLLNSDDVD